MKKFLVLAIAFVTISQISKAQISIGIKGGRTFSFQDRTDVSDNTVTFGDAFKGGHIGLHADLPITNFLSLQPELLYVRKGAKFTTKQGDWTKVNLSYIEMPVNAVVKLNVGFAKVIAGAGPVLSYGIGGKMRQNDQKTRVFGDGKQFRRWDVSGNALVGMEFNGGFFWTVNYQRGLIDISKSSASVKNGAVSVSIGKTINWTN